MRRSQQPNAASINNDTARQEGIDWALKSESEYRLRAVLNLAQHEPQISDPGDGWDSDPFLLGVENGVVDLRTGNLRAAVPEDRILLRAPVKYSPDAPCPQFEKFLDSRFAITRLTTLAKVADANIDGRRIEGNFDSDRYLSIPQGFLIAERFANCPASPDAIVRFTCTYGPLKVPARPGAHFNFEIADWLEQRTLFQMGWKQLASLGLRSRGMGAMVALGDGSLLTFWRDGVSIQLPTLRALIDVVMMMIPIERLRICAAPTCLRPYFVAHHLKQTLCGAQKCRSWNINRLKKEYWERNKGPILAERRRIRKEA